VTRINWTIESGLVKVHRRSARRPAIVFSSTTPSRDATTRQRILEGAAALIHRQGVAATDLHQVARATDIDPAHVRHEFADKEILVRAAVQHQAEMLLAYQEHLLGDLRTWRGLEGWARSVVEATRASGAYGCPVGALVGQLAEHSDDIRNCLDQAFRAWESQLAAALRRMQAHGELDPAANAMDLAVGLLAALQGGLILAQTALDERRLQAALKMALGHVASARIQPSH
jgi:TetR/AcrR family transcriptional regulator, transcriptional repressor for nem operon